MTKEHKCEAILKRIVEIVNNGGVLMEDKQNRIEFAADIGRNRATVLYRTQKGDGHHHIDGNIEKEWNRFVNDLYSFLLQLET